MSLPIHFHPDVQREVQIADRYYEQDKLGSGRKFVRAVKRVLREIEQNPAQFRVCRRYNPSRTR